MSIDQVKLNQFMQKAVGDLGAIFHAALVVVVTKGGFTRFRRASETPFNLVFEARP